MTRIIQLHDGLLLDRLHPDAIAENDLQPPRDWIENELDKREAKAKEPAKPKTALSPSLVSLSSCSLETWFSFFPGAYPWIDPQPVSVRRQWNEAAVKGDWVHARWQTALQQSNLVRPEDIEAKVSDVASPGQMEKARQIGYSENARIDFRLDEETIGEIKGIGDKDFAPGNQYFEGKLKPDQALQYQFITEMKRTHFVAINRDAKTFFSKATVREYILERDEYQIGRITLKARKIIRAVQAQEMPEPEPSNTRTYYYCKNLCGHSSYCSVGKIL